MRYLSWIDTRDMSADGLTKGAVSRELLRDIMQGSMSIKHIYEHWNCKRRAALENSVDGFVLPQTEHFMPSP